MTAACADTDDRDAPLNRRLGALFDSLGRQEKRVAREVLRDYPVSALTTTAALAEQSGASTATVLRLAQRLGFESFADFHVAVKRDLHRLLQSPMQRLEGAAPDEAGEGGFLSRHFARLAGNLGGCVDTVMESDFDALVGLLADPRRDVTCVGGRYGRHFAGLLSDNLGVLRDRVRFADGQSDGWARLLLETGPRSVVIVVDIRRYQASVRRFATLAAARGATVALVTDFWAAPRDYAAHWAFRLPTASPSLMDSYAGPLALIEALIGATALKFGDAIRDRLTQCEEMDCAERDLAAPWPGVAQPETAP